MSRNMAEHSHQPLPEIVSKWVAAVAEVEPKKKKLVTPTKIQERIEELAKSTPKDATETRGAQERRKAKELAEKIQASQRNITATMEGLKESLRYKDISSFDQAKKQCETAWNLAKKKPDWLGKAFSPDQIQHSAAAAKFVEKVSLLPKDLADDPNVLFHMSAELSASMSADPLARAEEIKMLNQAILHIRELRDHNPAAGFLLNNEDLTYTLRGYVLYDQLLDTAIPAGSDIQGFLQEFQDRIDHRGKIDWDQQIRFFDGIAGDINKGDGVKINAKKQREWFKVNKDELQTYIDRTNRKVEELKMDKNNAQERYDVTWSSLSSEQKQRIVQHPDNQPVNLYGFSAKEQELLLSGDIEKIKEFFSDFIADIYGVGREQKHPELPDQTKYDRFKTALEWIYGEKAKAIKVQFEMAWSDRGKQEYTLKALAYMPGDIKDKLMAFRKLLGADLDWYAGYNEYAPLAIGFMQEAVPMLLGRKQGAYNEALKFVQKKVDQSTIPDWLKTALEITDADSNLDYDGLFVKYQKALVKGRLEGANFTNPAQLARLNDFKTREMGELKKKIDTVGFGVQLYDDDVLVYNEARIAALNAEDRYTELKRKPEDSLTTAERQELDRLPNFIKQKSEQAFRLSERDAIKNPSNSSVVEKYQEFSPLEAQVLDMLERYLLAKGKSPEEIMNQRWKIRDAIWAARMHTIGSGYIVDRNAFMVTRPKNVELKSYEFTDHGRYTMISPFMEDIQRIINPELFAWRFQTGGAMGERAFALLRSGQYPEGGKLTESDAWWQDEKDVTNPQTKRVRRMMEYAEQRMGISFSELLGSGFMKGGVYFDATAWRLDEGLLVQIQQSMAESGLSPEAWENGALGLQLLVAGDKTARERILRKMSARTPLVFVEFMAGKEMNAIYSRHNVSETDQRLFQEILAQAQTKLWDDKNFIERVVNLSSQQDFNDVVAPFMDQMGPEVAGKKELFRSLIGDVQHAADRVIPEWSKGQLPITLALSGLDWSKSYFAKLGTAAMDRRGRDMGNMAAARDMMFTILSEPELLGPEKFDDLIKKLKEYEGSLNNYLPRSDAEKMTQQLLRVICLFNQNRATKFLNPIGWIPGVTSLLKNVGQVEIGHLQPFHLFGEIGKGKRDGKNALEEWAKNNSIAGRKIKDIPLCLSELVSLSVRFQGPEGNAWDEFKMTAFLNKVQRAGLFQNSPELLNALRRETHATLGWRFFYGIPRKYWWVVPVATVALATSESINDEKKKK